MSSSNPPLPLATSPSDPLVHNGSSGDQPRSCNHDDLGPIQLPSPTSSAMSSTPPQAPALLSHAVLSRGSWGADHRNHPQRPCTRDPSEVPFSLLTPPSSAASATSTIWCRTASEQSHITPLSLSPPLITGDIIPHAMAFAVPTATAAAAAATTATMAAHSLVPPFRPPSMIELGPSPSLSSSGPLGRGPASSSHSTSSSTMVDQLRQMQPQALAALLTTRPKAAPPLADDPCHPSERFPVLIIDLRPYSAFEAGHIVGAVNLCLPTTLLKRKTFDMSKVLANASDADRATLACWSRVQHIVLYDACCPLPVSAPPTSHPAARPSPGPGTATKPAFTGLSLAMKCKPSSPGVPESPVPYMATKLAPSSATVHCLYGGFEAFSRAFPRLVARPKPPVADTAPSADPSPQSQDVPMSDVTPTATATPTLTTADQKESPLSSGRLQGPNRSLHLTLPPHLAGKSPAPTHSPASTFEQHAQNHHSHHRQRPIGKSPIGGTPHCSRPPDTPMGPPTARRSGPPALRLNLSQVNKVAPPVFSFKTKFRQLSSVGPTTLSAHAPEWLKSLVATGGIISELQAKFLDIKLSEPPPPTNCVTSKNRYYNVFPFDHNRVRLPHRSPNLSPAEPESDYINASRINPPYTKDEFIATQAPLPETMGDFWSMVHGEHATVILNLAPESEIQVSKAIKYWPDRGEHLQLAGSDMHVAWPQERDPETGAGGDEDRFEFGIKRRWLRVWRDSDPDKAFTVAHISFEDWDDGDAPSVDSVMYLLRLVSGQQHPGSPLALQEGAIGLPPFHASCPGPMVVHCSAGCGRTGTYIAMHSLLQLLARALQPPTPAVPLGSPTSASSASSSATLHSVPRPESIAAARELISQDPIPALVRNLRAQRMMMVQSSKQYMFIYEAMIAIIQAVKPKCVFPSRVGRAAGCGGCLHAVTTPPALSPAAESAAASQRSRQGSIGSMTSSQNALSPPNPFFAPNATCENSQPANMRARPSRPLSDSAVFAALGVPKEWTTHAHVGLHHLLTRTPSSGMLKLSPTGAGAEAAAHAAASSFAKVTGSPDTGPSSSALCHGNARRYPTGAGSSGGQQPFFFSLVPST